MSHRPQYCFDDFPWWLVMSELKEPELLHPSGLTNCYAPFSKRLKIKKVQERFLSMLRVTLFEYLVKENNINKTIY